MLCLLWFLTRGTLIWFLGWLCWMDKVLAMKWSPCEKQDWTEGEGVMWDLRKYSPLYITYDDTDMAWNHFEISNSSGLSVSGLVHRVLEAYLTEHPSSCKEKAWKSCATFLRYVCKYCTFIADLAILVPQSQSSSCQETIWLWIGSITHSVSCPLASV